MTALPLCYILVGPSGAGKSKWATDSKMPVVSADGHIRDSEAFRAACTSQISANVDFVVDATHLTRFSRKWILWAIWRRYTPVAVIFETPLDVCLARNLEREEPRHETMIKRMYDCMEAPDHREISAKITV